MLSVRQTVHLYTMLFIYNLLHGLMPAHLLQMCKFATDVHEHNTRNRDNFYISTVKTNYAQNNLFNQGINSYNN